MPRRKQLSWLNICVVAVLCCMAWFVALWIHFLVTPVVADQEGLHYSLEPGTSIKVLAQDLYQKNIISHPTFFIYLARWHHDVRKLKAGEYLFASGTTPSKMLEQMVTGSGMIYHSFTIVSGWNFHQIINAINAEPRLQHHLQGMSETDMMLRIAGVNLSPEGWFFPETYFYTQGSSDVALLRRAYRAMQDKLNFAWKSRAPQLPYANPYEALIAASLVEKEAFLDNERVRIAGVLVNRLRKGMRLQFDPTVIYGMGQRYDGKIHRTNLREDNPFNTYMRNGLPPTPIATPSLGSIVAVLHPSVSDELYFVARGDGSHIFSKNFNEHDIAVKKYQLANAYFYLARYKPFLHEILSKGLYEHT